MNTAFSKTASAAPLSSTGGWLRRARAWLAGPARWLQSRRHCMLDALQLAQLDARALRDLGICRSEFDSFRAEAIDEAEHTRLRIAILQAGGAAR